MGKRSLLTAAAVAALACLVVWALLPWQWSLIDDPGLRLQALHGWHGGATGVWHVFTHQWSADRSWGLFRPAYWIYVTLFYLLPVGVAHSVRLALLLAALALPAVAVHRSGRGGKTATFAAMWVLLAMAANRSIYNGLSWLSLQELSGAAFVSAGFFARSRRLRFLCFVVAAWFKPAFIWLVIADCVELATRPRCRRFTVLVAAPLAVATLALVLWFAHGGTYTRIQVDGHTALTAAKALIKQNAVVAVVIALGVATLRLSWSDLRSRSAVVFIAGAAGYAAQLLVWRGAGTYLYAPPGLLIALAFAAAVQRHLEEREQSPTPRRSSTATTAAVAAATAIAVAATASVVAIGVARTRQRDAAVRDIVGFAARTAPGTALAVTDAESAVRLQQIEQLDHPNWRGTFAYIGPGAPPPSAAAYLVHIADTDTSPAPPGWCVVRSAARAKIYQRC